MANKKDPAFFGKMLALAELAADGHKERRQVEFRVLISYVTILALASYQSIKLSTSTVGSVPGWIFWVVGFSLVVVHVFYWMWQRVIHIACLNDVRRRDFYLAKAEVIFYHLFQDSNLSSSIDSSEENVVVNFASGQSWITTDSVLFKERFPCIYRSEPSCKKPHKIKLWKDWHFLFHIVFPTFLLSLVICTLVFKKLKLFTIVN